MKFEQEQLENGMHVLALQWCAIAYICSMSAQLTSNDRNMLDQVKSHKFATPLPEKLEN